MSRTKKEFLNSLDSSLVEELRPRRFSSSSSAKILELQWSPDSDQFSINVDLEDIPAIPMTKQMVASLAARIYDPLGFVTPVTIRAEVILQDLWREQVDWDEPIT